MLRQPTRFDADKDRIFLAVGEAVKQATLSGKAKTLVVVVHPQAYAQIAASCALDGSTRMVAVGRRRLQLRWGPTLQVDEITVSDAHGLVLVRMYLPPRSFPLNGPESLTFQELRRRGFTRRAAASSSRDVVARSPR